MPASPNTGPIELKRPLRESESALMNLLRDLAVSPNLTARLVRTLVAKDTLVVRARDALLSLRRSVARAGAIRVRESLRLQGR